MTNNNVNQSQGFFEMLKNYFLRLTSELQESHYTILKMVFAFGAGSLFGFLIKRYSNYVIAFILFIIGIVALQHFEFLYLVINRAKMESMFGIQEIPITSDFFSVLGAWVKLNIGVSISFVIGMVVGLKLA